MLKAQAYGVLLTGILVGVVGQLLLKHGMARQPSFRMVDLVALVRNMPVLSGFGCYALSTVLYLSALAHLELSLAFPTVSLGYVMVMVLSRLLFKEPVSRTRWVAAGVICLGVALVGLGAP